MEIRKGRGAVSNCASERFNLPAKEVDGDWKDLSQQIDGPAQRLRTTVTDLHPKTILSFNASPDIPFDRSVNAYNGCEHGCTYCYARPSHAWHDLSPGIDFETQLFAKPDAPRLLRETLAKPGYRPAPIALGTNTDPYQPIEGRYRITRQILELCLEAGHPVTITTKSDRLLRDIDLLQEMALQNLVSIGISVTSLDPTLSQQLEPRAASPARRLAALGKLAEAGITCHVGVAPIIPAITDTFIEAILEAASQRGVQAATWIIVRLPYEVAPLFREWLQANFPDRASKVMATIQSIRGGKDNDPAFHTRMRPNGVWADLIARRMTVSMRKLGMIRPHAVLDIRHFRRPSLNGQLSLF